mmetsp:Transcript_12486/g.38094  ORF Transcript_12486/g.38094 Transcript_12486/m.38094 type:complete len:1094 (+) Transcript_12486:240-3521(+)|eukprot:CAMPEP_0198732344 /NCGR_PEP_ID=MMETSP1475-20131203/35168_1 /TAXON_ID= ORGANISM="Unidentified sp., Strain CCMP1999" /NCGR_SAMPLE_ID=MMETSP1475 /ASSEMBLY_ACC=CAM_ASM_001111 /LENGTH=1093 /DNA_ID=CAMNT_0044495429 /DNA_START=133 /DNA_END=3414 /DNA_ORIENTATION=-
MGGGGHGVGFQLSAGAAFTSKLQAKTCRVRHQWSKATPAVRIVGNDFARSQRAKIGVLRCSATSGPAVKDVEVLQDEPLPVHPELRRGRLPNGLEYVILPNDSPSGRFEAHLEVFAGSTVEDENQQGIAHVVEHVAYMGSEKRERLLSGTGASTNAHTDFHHTVFFAACPSYVPRTGKWVMPMALDALLDVMEAKIEPSRVEKERAAILSEMLMVNTIEYRVECQLLASLHAENVIPNRFPIGMENQIRAWTADDVKKFHRTHYRPNNAVLYIAGDFGSSEDVEAEVIRKFSHLQNSVPERDVAKGTLKETRSRHFPAVIHKWSNLYTPLSSPTDVRLFRHELLSSFSLHIYAKNPLQEVTSLNGFRRSVLRKLGYTALQIRLNMAGRSEELAGEAPFSTVEFLDQDSPREACEVRSLDLTAKPSLWRAAVRVAVRELRRFAKFGLTAGEYERLRVTLLSMSQQSIMQDDMAPTSDRIEELMEAVAAGHTYLTPEDNFHLLEEEVQTIGLDEMNRYIKEMCAHGLWFEPNSDAPSPNSIVACAPTSVTDLTEESLMEAMKEAGAEEVEPTKDIDVPRSLMKQSEFDQLSKDENAKWAQSRMNSTQSFMLGRLENGVYVNALRSHKKSGRCSLRVTCPGGRSVESVTDKRLGPIGPTLGSVALGATTLQEGGAIGEWSREQVELFCIDNLLEVYVQAEEDALYIEFAFPSEKSDMILQILRGLMNDFRWETDAFARGREALEQRHREVESSLEESSRAAILKAMTEDDVRFRTPSPAELDELSIDSVSKSIDGHIVTEGMEISVVGDFDMMKLLESIRVYIGSVSKRESSFMDILPQSLNVGTKGKSVRVNLADTDARAVVYVAGKMPSGWGFNSDGSHVTIKNGKGRRSPRDILLRDTQARREHPLFAYVTFGILREVMTRRMFSELREEANLSYEANFKIVSFDNLHGGYYLATATAAPENAQKALELVQRTLSALREGRSSITWANLENARRSVIGRFEGGMEVDGYIVQLMSGLQLSTNSLKSEHFFEDLIPLTESITVDDLKLLLKTMSLEEGQMYTCVGVSEGLSDLLQANEAGLRVPPRGGSTVLRH